MPTRGPARSIRLLLFVMVTLTLLTLVPASRAQAANLFTVTNTNDSGPGSLRQAMINANNRSDGSAALIAFNIPSSDPGYGLDFPGIWTIRLLNDLPTLTRGGVTIDGLTQTTNWGNTNPLGPEVQIDGIARTYGGPDLRIESSNNTVKGLLLTHATFGIVIAGSEIGTTNNYISQNYMKWNGSGVMIYDGSFGNFILSNVILHSSSCGIEIRGLGTDSNQILGNDIGTGQETSAPIYVHGIYVYWGP